MKTTDKLFAGLILLLFFIVVTLAITTKSITNDELAHIAAGYSYWKTFDYRMNVEHPPLMKLMAGTPLLFLNPELPKTTAWKQGAEWIFGQQFFFEANPNADQLVFWARMPMVFVAMLLGFYIFKWASELYGRMAGYTALILYTFNPLVLGHAGLVTTDIGVAAFIFITLYYLWKFCQNPTHKHLFVTGIMLGLALSAKFTGIYLLPVVVILMATWQVCKTGLRQFLRPKAIQKMLLNLLIIFGVAIIILVLTYGIFEFPKYFSGFRQVSLHSSLFGHKSYLFGSYSETGFRYYFFIAFLFKEPIPLLIMLLAAVFMQRWLLHNSRNELFLLIPALIYLAAFVMNNINIGIRHILPVYPILFVFASKITTWKFRYKYIPIVLLLGGYITSSFLIFPHYLAYFNELGGGPEKGYNILIDSNIDWGQDLKGLKQWMGQNGVSSIKMAYFGHDSRSYRNISYEELPCGPSKGLMAISVNRLVGFDEKEHQCFKWLRDSTVNPITIIGYSIYVYNITEEQYQHGLNLACGSECQKFCSEKGLLFGESRYTIDKCLCNCASSNQAFQG